MNYEEKIRDALDKGTSPDEMRDNLEANIKRVLDQIDELKQEFNSLKAFEKAYYKFFNPEPILLSDESLIRHEPINPFMTASQLRIWMGENHITSTYLARETKIPYAHIVKFRRGLLPIPRELAEFVKIWADDLPRILVEK